MPNGEGLDELHVITTAIVSFTDIKMKLAVFALLFGSAVAFAPAHTSKVRSADGLAPVLSLLGSISHFSLAFYPDIPEKGDDQPHGI